MSSKVEIGRELLGLQRKIKELSTTNSNLQIRKSELQGEIDIDEIRYKETQAAREELLGALAVGEIDQPAYDNKVKVLDDAIASLQQKREMLAAIVKRIAKDNSEHGSQSMALAGCRSRYLGALVDEALAEAQKDKKLVAGLRKLWVAAEIAQVVPSDVLVDAVGLEEGSIPETVRSNIFNQLDPDGLLSGDSQKAG